MTSDKHKVVLALTTKKVVFRTNREDETTAIEILDGSGGVIHFTTEGKLAGVSRTVKASLAKHINRAVFA